MALGDEKRNAEDTADATSRTTQNYEKMGRAFSKYLEDQQDSYDLSKLFNEEIKKQIGILDKVNKYHADLTVRLKNQKKLIEEQNVKTNGLAVRAREAAAALQEQVNIVSAQLDVVKELDAQYARTAAVRKMTGDVLRQTYSEINDEENKLLALQEEKQAKEDAFAKLKARNLKYDEIRTNLGWDMVKAIQTGNQAEVDAINKKLKLTNNLIKFTSDEMDANRTRVEMITKQTDESRKLLQEKRKQAVDEEKVVNNLGKELRAISQKRVAAKQELAAQESVLEKKQAEYTLTKNLFGLNMKRLGEMKEEAARMEANLSKYEKMRAVIKQKIELLKTVKQVVGEADKFLESTGEHYGKTKALIMDIAKGGATAWLAVIKASLDRWIELDKAAGEFRKKTGFLVNQTKELDKAAREVNVQMAHLGVGISEAYAAAGALTEEFQVIGLVTKEAIANTAMVAANLGIGVAESAKFKGMFESIAESSGTTADGAIKSAAALAKMGGVAPSAVMKDMASASGETLSFLAKSPMALMKAAVEARRLGTTVGALSKSARGFLNYQDSITSELEASALIGKALNFQEARAAAYAGDVVKSRELALKQIEKAGDFTKLNVYQQEALAKAAGMTVDEVIKQQNQQKLLAKLESTRPELYAKYKEMQEKVRENEKAAAGDLEKQAEEMAKQQLMQAEMNKLSNAFASIWTDITDALLPIANTIMPVLITTVRGFAVIFKIIGGLIRGLFSPIEKFFDSFRSGNESALKLEEIFAKIGPTVEKITAFAVGLTGTLMHAVTGVATMYAMMIPVVNIFSKLKISIGQAFQPFTILSEMFTGIATRITNFAGRLSGLSKIFTPFLSMGSSMFRLFGMIAKFAGPIGLVVNVIQFAFSLFKRFSEMEWGDSIGENILLGIKAIGGALYDVLIQPFFDLWNWLKEKFISNSPSELGLRIVEGIKSVGSMLMDALTWPFRTVFNFVSGLFGGDGELGNKIVEGIKSIGEFMFDALTWPFRTVFNFVSGLFGGDGELGNKIVEGIKSVGSMLMDALTWPFRTVFNFVSGLFGGDGELGTKIVDGMKSAFRSVVNFISGIFGGTSGVGAKIVESLKSIGEFMFDALTWPFKKLMSFASKIPFIGKFFGGGNADASANVTVDAQVKSSTQPASTVEVKGLDELKETVDKLVDAITKLGGAGGAGSPVVNINNDSAAMAAKLDELIGLLKDGSIGVNIDGIKASKIIARTA
jgi:methylglyoxal synthase